jgi:hypothetical protein
MLMLVDIEAPPGRENLISFENQSPTSYYWSVDAICLSITDFQTGRKSTSLKSIHEQCSTLDLPKNVVCENRSTESFEFHFRSRFTRSNNLNKLRFVHLMELFL